MHGFKNLAALAMLALALGLTACSDDENESEPAGNGGAATETTATETERTQTTDADMTRPVEPGDGKGGGATAPSGESPEEQPGGAGDEVPASSQALISGLGGEFHPTVVHVPPFIAIRVRLRSEDGARYVLRGEGRQVEAGADVEATSTLFDGLRPGERLVLRGPQGSVAIEANAEPGP
ncbi:MAG: hypothetical protein WD993_06460 [Thermoleophilaceae bacterium]